NAAAISGRSRPCVSEITPTTYTSRFMSDRLFTPRFFVMCGFTFTVFLSAFQLLPTAPFRIQELGGSTFASGLFLGFLTYASAASAPLTGAIADRIGRRRTLMISSSVILLCAIGYGSTTSYRLMLALVVVHGVFWLSITLFLYSFGYGAITSFSAMYADASGVSPRSLYLTCLAIVILLTRPLSGKLADRVGYRRVFMPCLVLIAVGLALLAAGSTRISFVASAALFGVGLGTAYPVFVAYVMRDVSATRRGAAFGPILAA